MDLLSPDEYVHLCSFLPFASLLQLRVCKSLREMFTDHIDTRQDIWMPLATSTNQLWTIKSEGKTPLEQSGISEKEVSLLHSLSIFRPIKAFPSASDCLSLFVVFKNIVKNGNERYTTAGITCDIMSKWSRHEVDASDSIQWKVEMKIDWRALLNGNHYTDIYIWSTRGVVKIAKEQIMLRDWDDWPRIQDQWVWRKGDFSMVRTANKLSISFLEKKPRTPAISQDDCFLKHEPIHRAFKTVCDPFGITYGTWVRVLVKEERFVGVGAGAHLRILFCQSHISQINDLFDHFCIGDMSAISFQRKPLGEAILTRIKTPPTPFARRPSL
jgi:hypothetical protein